eukprot:TRINITY_DN3073_c0_g1_i1.p1 TRINITY_DN3073_c0_g1~~TRINITY_DN3073_c0_g1_i1.p1  ORF type:complete len:1167 (-),score=361.97 TRINITY_DN3073_c0_g1_i1:96-3416(-)
MDDDFSDDDEAAIIYLLSIIVVQVPKPVIVDRFESIIRLIFDKIEKYEENSFIKYHIQVLEYVFKIVSDQIGKTVVSSKIRDLFPYCLHSNGKLRHSIHTLYKTLAESVSHSERLSKGFTQLISPFMANFTESSTSSSLTDTLYILQLVTNCFPYLNIKSYVSAKEFSSFIEYIVTEMKLSSPKVSNLIIGGYDRYFTLIQQSISDGETVSDSSLELNLNTLLKLRLHITSDEMTSHKFVNSYTNGVLSSFIYRNSQDILVDSPINSTFLERKTETCLVLLVKGVFELKKKTATQKALNYLCKLTETCFKGEGLHIETMIDKFSQFGDEMLSINYQWLWPVLFQWFSVFFRCFPAKHFEKVQPLIEKLDEIYFTFIKFLPADNAETTEELDIILPAPAARQHFFEMFSSLISNVKPSIILDLLPLGLSTENSRIYLVRALQKSSSNSQLSVFKTPLLEEVQELVSLANDSEIPEEKAEIIQLVEEIWKMFPSFCLYPIDFDEVFPSLVNSCGGTIKNASIFAPYVGIGLKNLVDTCLWEFNNNENGQKQNLSLAKGDIEGNGTALLLARSFDFARLLMLVASPAKNNKFSDSQFHQIVESISALSSVLNSEQLIKLFEIAFKTLEQSIVSEALDSGNFALDMVIAILEGMKCHIERLGSISDFSTEYLSEIKGKVIACCHSKVVSYQKKGYRCLLSLTSIVDFDFFENIDFENDLDIGSVLEGSKSYRLQLFTAVLKKLFEEENKNENFIDVVSSFIPETILGFASSSQKTRNAAIDLLNTIVICLTSQGIVVDHIVLMLLAGIDGETQHMVAASLQTVTSLLVNHKDEIKEETFTRILQVTCELFQTKSREIARPLFGLIRTIVACAKRESYEKYTADILLASLHYFTLSKKFQQGVKILVERLLRKYDDEELMKLLKSCANSEGQVITAGTERPLNVYEKILKNQLKTIRRSKREKLKEYQRVKQNRKGSKIDEIIEDVHDMTIAEAEKLVDAENEDADVIVKDNDHIVVMDKSSSYEEKANDEYDSSESNTHKYYDKKKRNNTIEQPRLYTTGKQYQQRKAGGDRSNDGSKPMAYLPFNPKILNKRNKRKEKGFEQFFKNKKK